MANLKYASFELNPCVYDDREAWVLFVPERGLDADEPRRGQRDRCTEE
jgi:hypothetical protein